MVKKETHKTFSKMTDMVLASKLKTLSPSVMSITSIHRFLSPRYGTSHQVTDMGVGLQIWRLAVNILNKQSWTDDQEWSSSLGVWHEG